MLYANSASGVRVRADKGVAGTCPDCGRPMCAKCGKIITPHWAHLIGEACDSWSEGETEWHRYWKLRFPPECVEITVKRNGDHHRADVMVRGIVLEVQHSSISTIEIEQREAFYGPMIWLFDAREAWSDGRISVCWRNPKSGTIDLSWKHPRKSLIAVTRPLFLDIGDGRILFVVDFKGDGFLTAKQIDYDKFIAKVNDADGQKILDYSADLVDFRQLQFAHEQAENAVAMVNIAVAQAEHDLQLTMERAERERLLAERRRVQAEREALSQMREARARAIEQEQRRAEEAYMIEWASALDSGSYVMTWL